MNNRILISLVGAAALALTGCSGGSTAAKPEVEDKSVGAETSGARGAGNVEGKSLSTKGQDLLGKKRVYFTFDSSSIDDESRPIVEAHANYLAANKGTKVTLEGHADERGTREYNLALGERRAQAVERMVKLLGVSADRVKVVSYGEEKALAAGHDDGSWSQNRRVEIVY